MQAVPGLMVAAACLVLVFDPQVSVQQDRPVFTVSGPAGLVATGTEPAANRVAAARGGLNAATTETGSHPARVLPRQPSPLESATTTTGAARSAAIGAGCPSAELESPALDVLTPFDDLRTSWESPFSGECWDSLGWSFDGHAMRSTIAGAAATFSRPYARLMFDCLIEPLSEAPGQLVLQLHTSETQGALCVVIEGASISLVAKSESGMSRVVRQAGVQPGLMPGAAVHFRLAAPGNRLLVSWNNRVVVACEAPGELGGRPAEVTLIAPASPMEIRGLRIEGE